MSHYKHFTTKEREKILFFFAQEKTISFIAKELQRDKSSVSREIKRNTIIVFTVIWKMKAIPIWGLKMNRPPKVRPKI